MQHSPKRHAYLVAVSQKDEAVRVFAVLTTAPDEAQEAVARNVPPKTKLEIVGVLARGVTKRLRLKPREPLQV
ncbi:hypothetical protein MKK65_18595 [Methylobacterium sp. J-001]|uniref:hypothetical protein n=1 Tax=Methylobacterium sp. J-001 TaxID=2836609 RepID=UPI001FB9F5C6|nr:hypothetical protein [Methylobacterium sp. J-001]MCJ2118547.1 hypothetical protein [Methylobacterium sp. J-001]